MTWKVSYIDFFIGIILSCDIVYPTDGNAVAIERTNLGQDPPPTVLNSVDCDGTETNIAQCPESSRCLSPGAGVICPVQNGNYIIQ